MPIYMNQYTYSRIQTVVSLPYYFSSCMFIARNASRLHPPLLSTRSALAWLCWSSRLDTVIVSVSVVVELVVIVKESDDEAAAAATTDDGAAG
jgi:hypothetical protein